LRQNQEKFDAYLIRLSWSDVDIVSILKKRVSEAYRSQYTNDNVQFHDVFPSHRKHGGEAAIKYLIDRTLLRPRDAIQFSNECFSSASDRERVSWSAMKTAEANYSRKRVNSLVEEWEELYPSLRETIEIMRGLAPIITRSSIPAKREHFQRCN